MTGDYALVAARRWWGVRMVGLWARPEQPAIDAAPSPPPQAPVIHIHIHASDPIGIDQAVRIIQATPEWAVTAGITEGTGETGQWAGSSSP